MTAPERLPPEIAELFAREHERPGPDAATSERLLGRVFGTLGLLPPGGGGGSTPGGGSPEAGSANSGGSLHPAAAGTSTLPQAGSSGFLGGKTLVIAVGALLVGAAAGAGIHAGVNPSPPPRIERPMVPRIVVVPAPAGADRAPRDPVLTPDDLAREVRARPSISASASPSATPSRDLDLARERTLLTTARTALAKRDGTKALAALDRHAREFPNGRLAEERESLRVQALVLLGQRELAKQHADAFRQQYPQSLLRGAVEESVKSE